MVDERLCPQPRAQKTAFCKETANFGSTRYLKRVKWSLIVTKFCCGKLKQEGLEDQPSKIANFLIYWAVQLDFQHSLDDAIQYEATKEIGLWVEGSIGQCTKKMLSDLCQGLVAARGGVRAARDIAWSVMLLLWWKRSQERESVCTTGWNFIEDHCSAKQDVPISLIHRHSKSQAALSGDWKLTLSDRAKINRKQGKSKLFRQFCLVYCFH